MGDLPDLITHAMVADKIGVSTSVLRTWVAEGEFPEPHAIIKQTWFYRLDLFRAFLEMGSWPVGTKFKRRRGFESLED